MHVTTRTLAGTLLILGGALVLGSSARAADDTPTPATPAPAAGAADKILLKDVDLSGDQNTSDELFQIDFALKGKLGGLEVPIGQFSNIKKTKYLDDTVVQSATSKFYRRKYSVSREFESTPDGSQKTVASYEGKTVTLKRFGDKKIVLVDKGKLSAKERKDLAEQLDDSEDSPYPDHPVGPGDEWDIDPKKGGKFFGKQDDEGLNDMKGHLKFVDYTTYDGQKCARLEMTMSMKGKSGPADMSMDVKGTCYYSVDLKHTLMADMSGPVTLQGKVKQGDEEIEIGGTGKTHMRFVYHYLKKGGKLVKPQAAVATPAPPK